MGALKSFPIGDWGMTGAENSLWMVGLRILEEELDMLLYF